MEYGSSLLGNLWCLLRSAFSFKLFPHSEQEKGRSPLCSFRCLLRSAFSMKLFPHSGQKKGHSNLWILWCNRRCLFNRKRFPHSEQEKRDVYRCDFFGVLTKVFTSLNETFSTLWTGLWTIFHHKLKRGNVPKFATTSLPTESGGVRFQVSNHILFMN